MPNANLYDLDGTKVTIADMSAMSGLNKNTIKSRLLRGETPKEAIKPGFQYKGPAPYVYAHEGVEKTPEAWGAELGISKYTFLYRYRQRPEGLFVAGQLRHGRAPKLITHDGRSQSLNDWAAELGITRSTLEGRLDRCPDKAFTKGKLKPAGGRLGRKQGKLHEAFGELRPLSAWADLAGCTYGALLHRIKGGKSLEEALFIRPLNSERFRPCFTFSKGGRLKGTGIPANTPAQPSETTGGMKQLSAHPRTPVGTATCAILLPKRLK